MREAAKLLEGYHDFRTFMGKSPQNNEKNTRRIMEYITIRKIERTGYSNIYSWPAFTNNDLEEYLFVDVYLKSKSFLYKQVSNSYYIS